MAQQQQGQDPEPAEQPAFTLAELTAAFEDLAAELEWREAEPRLPLHLLLARMQAERG